MHFFNADPGQLSLHMPRKLIVDNFAGGGGASTGLEAAFGRPVDIAINHDPEAISMHKLNHPDTKHYCESVWDVDPIKATAGLPIEWAHFSPDCTHHSKARGGKPKKKEIRGLAWVLIKWAVLTRPEFISLENVEEFRTWGPLDEQGQPIKNRAGETFKAFKRMLSTGIERDHPAVAELIENMPAGFNVDQVINGLGYSVDDRELIACDYGAPTTRKRLFLVARRDGEAVEWPAPTHGPGLIPHRAAFEIIDWSIPCPSIFERKRPLADNTMRRIAKGLIKFVIDAADPFLMPSIMTQGAGGKSALVEARLAPFITEFANASNQRNMPGDEPLRTICAGVKGGHFALVAPYLVKAYGGNYKGAGIDLRRPTDTITTTDHHQLISAFLIKYYGNDKDGVSLNGPLHTITTHERFGLVTVTIDSEPYVVVDIGMRMLQPHELYAAQGFPAGYVHDRMFDGRRLSKKAQVRMVGNSVPPCLISAIVKANVQASMAAAACKCKPCNSKA